jgi:hypothetical protein
VSNLPIDLFTSALDRAGVLWVGSRMFGLAAVQGNEVRVFDSLNAPLPVVELVDVGETPASTIEVVTARDGLLRVDGKMMARL